MVLIPLGGTNLKLWFALDCERRGRPRKNQFEWCGPFCRMRLRIVGISKSIGEQVPVSQMIRHIVPQGCEYVPTKPLDFPISLGVLRCRKQISGIKSRQMPWNKRAVKCLPLSDSNV